MAVPTIDNTQCPECGEEKDEHETMCSECFAEQDEALDPDWDEDFGGYPNEEPARWARHCRAMHRAMDEGVD